MIGPLVETSDGREARNDAPGAVSVRRLACCALLGVLLFVAAACGRPDPWEAEDPTEALKVFLAALEVKQLDLAWEFLLPEDRAVLEERRRAFVALAGDGIEREPWSFLNPGHVVSSAREYASMRVDASASAGEQEGTVVIVELHDGRTFEVTMVRRDGRWYVDLPLDTAPAPTSDDGAGERLRPVQEVPALTVPAATVRDPSVPAPTVPDPSVPAATVPDPSVPAATVPDPSVSAPTGVSHE